MNMLGRSRALGGVDGQRISGRKAQRAVLPDLHDLDDIAVTRQCAPPIDRVVDTIEDPHTVADRQFHLISVANPISRLNNLDVRTNVPSLLQLGSDGDTDLAGVRIGRRRDGQPERWVFSVGVMALDPEPSDPPDCRLAAAGDEDRRTVFLFHLKCLSRRTTAEQRRDLTLAIAVLADGLEKPGNCRVTQSGA